MPAEMLLETSEVFLRQAASPVLIRLLLAIAISYSLFTETNVADSQNS